MSTASVPQLTPQQYLDIERKAAFKSEFFRGEMFAMAGASFQHNLIQANLIRRLAERLDGTICRPVGSDQRVLVTATSLYTYSDVVIFCDPPQFSDKQLDTLLTPKVLIEILSDSTEKYDRGTKSAHYRQIDSLQEYVLVSQSEPRVEVYQRLPDGNWLLREALSIDQSITLASVGITLPLQEVYLRVEFPPVVPQTGEMRCSDP